MNTAFLTEPVPHAEAINLIRNKPAVSRDIYDAMGPEFAGRAMTITGIEVFDVVQAVQDKIATLPAGADWKKLRKEIAAEISPWLGDDEAKNRAKLLLNHHGRAAYAATNARIVHSQESIFTHLQYRSSRTSKEPRDSHAALDGLILPSNHPFWNTHTPPWEFGCNCLDPLPLTQEDADDVAKDERDSRVENRSVASPEQLAALENGMLVRGPNAVFNIQTPREKSGSGYEWNWRDATLPYEEIRKRWDAPVQAAFEAWASKQDVLPGSNLMQWLAPSLAAKRGEPESLGAMLAAAPNRSITPARLADLLRAEPDHPVAKAIKLWGDDEKRFTELMMLDTEEARAWRETMAATLRKLEPVQGEPVLYRGWSFETAEKMQAFMEENREGFAQKRVGMSASLDIDVPQREKFSKGEHSMIWQIQGTQAAVDARPLFEAVGAVAHLEREEEFIFPAGVDYQWIDSEGTEMEISDSAGNSRRIRLYTLQEVKS